MCNSFNTRHLREQFEPEKSCPGDVHDGISTRNNLFKPVKPSHLPFEPSLISISFRHDLYSSNTRVNTSFSTVYITLTSLLNSHVNITTIFVSNLPSNLSLTLYEGEQVSFVLNAKNAILRPQFSGIRGNKTKTSFNLLTFWICQSTFFISYIKVKSQANPFADQFCYSNNSNKVECLNNRCLLKSNKTLFLKNSSLNYSNHKAECKVVDCCFSLKAFESKNQLSPGRQTFRGINKFPGQGGRCGGAALVLCLITTSG